MPKKKEETYEEIFEKLEKLVRELESGELPLAEILKKFEDAVAALKKCYQILDSAQKKIEILTKDSLGEVTGKEEFEPEEESQ
jgi:exodeoxyribonuclease VII small subunit